MIPGELAAILLASALAPVLVVGHMTLFRRKRESTPGYVHIFLAFAFYIGVWFLAAFALWGWNVSGSRMIAGASTAGFVCLAYMQVFSQICRGFSLRIIVEVDRCRTLDISGIMREYSDGRGVDWLVDKRIQVLDGLNMLTRCPDGLQVAVPRGLRIGRLGILIKRILKPGQGG